MATAEADVLTAEGKFQQAKGDLQQAIDELRTRPNCGSVTPESSLRVISKNFRRSWPHDREASMPRRPPSNRPKCVFRQFSGTEGERGGRARRG